MGRLSGIFEAVKSRVLVRTVSWTSAWKKLVEETTIKDADNKRRFAEGMAAFRASLTQ
jgi:hypothetical protein